MRNLMCAIAMLVAGCGDNFASDPSPDAGDEAPATAQSVAADASTHLVPGTGGEVLSAGAYSPGNAYITDGGRWFENSTSGSLFYPVTGQPGVQIASVKIFYGGAVKVYLSKTDLVNGATVSVQMASLNSPSLTSFTFATSNITWPAPTGTLSGPWTIAPDTSYRIEVRPNPSGVGAGVINGIEATTL